MLQNFPFKMGKTMFESVLQFFRQVFQILLQPRLFSIKCTIRTTNINLSGHLICCFIYDMQTSAKTSRQTHHPAASYEPNSSAFLYLIWMKSFALYPFLDRFLIQSPVFGCSQDRKHIRQCSSITSMPC